MESAKILTPQLVFCSPSEPNIPEGPEYEKNINTISMHRDIYMSVAFKVLERKK